MKKSRLIAFIIAIAWSASFAVQWAIPCGVLAEDNDSADVAEFASQVAEQLRQGITDVTGNGLGDETDALAQLMHITGKIPNLETLPSILNGSLLGEKYLDKFSYTGTVSTLGYFRSASISYTLERKSNGKAVYYVADIYLRDINHFRTAFPDTGYRTTQLVKNMAKDNRAIVAINGDYFSAQKSLGIVVRNGIFYSEHVASRKDVCALFADGSMEVYDSDGVDIDELYDKQALHVWQFGPALLNEDGTSKSGASAFHSSLHSANPRTVLGYYEPGHYCFVTVEGRGEENSKGMTLTELSSLMEELGCVQAYNMDGGGSSVMADAENGVLNTPSSNRKCSDILFIVDDYTNLPNSEEE